MKSNPRKSLKYVILMLTCVAMPALLKEQILKKFAPIYGDSTTDFYFSFLYSFYSIPNIILPLIGGFMSDIFGYRQMSMVFMFFVVIGQGTVYMGCHTEKLKYMIFGRFLFGLGGESLSIASSVIINKWFVGQELSFANALNLSLIRSATVLNTIVSPRIAEHYGMTDAFGLGFIFTIISATGLGILVMIDSYVDKKEKKNKQDEEGILDNSQTVLDFQELINQAINDIGALPRLFWIITFIMTTFYTSIIIFISFSSPIIIELWLPADAPLEENQNVAGELMGIPYLCCTFFSPFIGILIDKIGQRIKVMIGSCVLVFIGQMSMLFFYPINAMILIGISYAFFASTVWTSIAFIVKQKQIGNCVWCDEFSAELCICLNAYVYSYNFY